MRFAKFSFVWLALLVPSLASAQERTPIWWGGVGFLVPDSGIKDLAPNTYAVLSDRKLAAAVEKRAVESLHECLSSRSDLEFISDTLPPGKSDVFLISLAFTTDDVERQSVDGNEIVNHDLQALVLVAYLSPDPTKQKIVTSFPVRIRYTLLGEQAISGNGPAQVFSRLLAAPEPQMPDVVAEWCRAAKQVQLREKNIWIRVPPFGLSSSAQAYLEATSKSTAEKRVVRQIGLRGSSILESRISQEFDIPIIPFGSNSATERMVLNLTDRSGSLYFVPQEADYNIRVDVDELRLVEQSMTTAGGNEVSGQAYAGRFILRIESASVDGGAGRELVKVLLRRVDIVDASGKKLVPVQQFARMIVNFSSELGRGLAKPDAKWIAETKSDAETAKPKTIAKALVEFVSTYLRQKPKRPS